MRFARFSFVSIKLQLETVGVCSKLVHLILLIVLKHAFLSLSFSLFLFLSLVLTFTFSFFLSLIPFDFFIFFFFSFPFCHSRSCCSQNAWFVYKNIVGRLNVQLNVTMYHESRNLLYFQSPLTI